MNDKKFSASTEIYAGIGMIVLAALLHVCGARDIFTMIVAPFGAGLILTDLLVQNARSKQVKARVTERRKK